MSIWGGKEEAPIHTQEISIQKDMTISDYAKANNLPDKLVIQLFNLSDKTESNQQLADTGISKETIKKRTTAMLAIISEHTNKNWLKIRTKFLLWGLFLLQIFFLLKKKKINEKNRPYFYLVSLIVFGVIFGSDPSAMGTVKDAIVLYFSKGAIFKPRLIAFSIFILTVVLANKFICSWGCQFGVLQDLLFRINQNKKTKKTLIRKFKIPFVLSNLIRILFFLSIIIFAFFYKIDIVHYIDPFKIYNPATFTLIAKIFISIILVLSLFIYRPWCNLFCPFGLLSWLFEKISFNRIRIDRKSCINCRKCVQSCPSQSMSGILDKKQFGQDCFSCGSCIEVCPTDSINFGTKVK